MQLNGQNKKCPKSDQDNGGWKARMGWVRVNDAEKKIVRRDADPQSEDVASAIPSVTYACYDVKTGTTGRDWYYIWVERESRWGWISSGISTLIY